MSVSEPLVIRNVPTGVPGLDAVLGGGLCEFSFNLIAGAPGSGKTTLVQQILFANATPERPALYFTVLGEPTIKMLRYQSQFGFFDTARVPSAVRFINLAAEATGGNLDAVFQRIGAEVAAVRPSFIAVDSFRTIVGEHQSPASGGVDRARALRQSSRAAAHDVGSHVVPDRRIRGHRATPSRLHGSRHDPLAVRGRRSQFGDAQAARGQGSRPKPDAGAAHVSAHRRGHAGLSAHPGTTAATRRSAERASRDRSARARRNDRRRHSSRRRRAAHRSGWKRQDHVRDALHRAGPQRRRELRRGGLRGIPRIVSRARENGFDRSRQHGRRRTARHHLFAARSTCRSTRCWLKSRPRWNASARRAWSSIRSPASKSRCADVSRGLSRIALSPRWRTHGRPASRC